MRCNSKANWRTILRGCLYGGFLQFQEGAIGKNKSSVESQGTSVELQEALIQYTGEPAGSSDGMRSGYCYHKTGCSRPDRIYGRGLRFLYAHTDSASPLMRVKAIKSQHMSEYCYYGMAAVLLLTTCWTFAVVRWFHTWPAPRERRLRVRWCQQT